MQARRSEKRDANAKAFLENANFPLKVNVGYGNEPFQGWINPINLNLSPETEADILWDVTYGYRWIKTRAEFIKLASEIGDTNGFTTSKNSTGALQEAGFSRSEKAFFGAKASTQN